MLQSVQESGRITLTADTPVGHIVRLRGRRRAPYVALGDLYPDKRYAAYGMKPHNWIEVKYFGGLGRAKGQEAKTQNSAGILNDMLRLCLYVREDRSRERGNGRYLLCVFNRMPQEYLALTRRSSGDGERVWLSSLFTAGTHKGVEISTEAEPATFRGGLSFIHGDADLRVKLDVVTTSSEPLWTPLQPLYWCHLVRVVNFDVETAGLRLVYDDASNEMWTQEMQDAQDQLARRGAGDTD